MDKELVLAVDVEQGVDMVKVVYVQAPEMAAAPVAGQGLVLKSEDNFGVAVVKLFIKIKHNESVIKIGTGFSDSGFNE